MLRVSNVTLPIVGTAPIQRQSSSSVKSPVHGMISRNFETVEQFPGVHSFCASKFRVRKVCTPGNCSTVSKFLLIVFALIVPRTGPLNVSRPCFRRARNPLAHRCMPIGDSAVVSANSVGCFKVNTQLNLYYSYI